MDWEEGERWRKGAEKDMPEDESEDKEGPRANFSHTPHFSLLPLPWCRAERAGGCV